jgi:hypothetical protein
MAEHYKEDLSMEFRKNQLQLLVECATEPTVIYLMENEASEPVPFLFSSDAPAFSGLTEKEYLEFYRSDAAKVILPQDLPIVEDTLSRVFRIMSQVPAHTVHFIKHAVRSGHRHLSDGSANMKGNMY